MKHLIGQTIRLEGRFKITTRLGAKDHSVIERERTRLETLWTEAKQNFSRLYDAYLLVENQRTDNKHNLFFGASTGAMARSVAEFTRGHLTDRARYFEAIQHLDHAAEAGLAACQKICNVIFHAYGGEGTFDLIRTGAILRRASSHVKVEHSTRTGPSLAADGSVPAQHLAALESAAWIITQTVDRSTFYTSMAAARRLHVLGSAQGKCLSPLQKREIISTALAPLLANLFQRSAATSAPTADFPPNKGR
jgi:hypothetical protein